MLSPWVQLCFPDVWDHELRLEIAPGHPLYGKSARALAAAQDHDDVLFELSDARYAVVHLTSSRRAAPHPAFPETQFFQSLGDWIEWMKAGHDDYTCGEAQEQNA